MGVHRQSKISCLNGRNLYIIVFTEIRQKNVQKII